MWPAERCSAGFPWDGGMYAGKLVFALLIGSFLRSTQ
jgi:hypothetical protein